MLVCYLRIVILRPELPRNQSQVPASKQLQGRMHVRSGIRGETSDRGDISVWVCDVWSVSLYRDPNIQSRDQLGQRAQLWRPVLAMPRHHHPVTKLGERHSTKYRLDHGSIILNSETNTSCSCIHVVSTPLIVTNTSPRMFSSHGGRVYSDAGIMNGWPGPRAPPQSSRHRVGWGERLSRDRRQRRSGPGLGAAGCWRQWWHTKHWQKM